MEPGGSSAVKAEKNKIIVILGPTASGKSDIAIKLAKKIDGEIISADSRQVYKGMDIGTGKVEGSFSEDKGFLISEEIPHHAIDICDPKKDFNVSDFKKYCEEKISEIINRKKIPIICGGTGFWIKSVVYDIDFPRVEPNPTLRRNLQNKPSEELFENLKKIDPQRAENIDPKNKVRLIRAIEICQKIGKVPPIEKKGNSNEQYEFLQIGISIYRERLNKKIEKRLKDRFKEGMIDEVEKLHKKGINWDRLESFGLEYRNIAEYLQGKTDRTEMEKKLYYDIIHYAKRQLTWFKKDKNIIWLKNYDEIEDEVRNFIKKRNKIGR